MDEYIERKAIRDALYDADAITMEGVKILNQFLQSDVAPVVHGRWIHKGGSDMWVCSRCGRSVNADPEGIDLYCYHCGAKMDESEDKNEIF